MKKNVLLCTLLLSISLATTLVGMQAEESEIKEPEIEAIHISIGQATLAIPRINQQTEDPSEEYATCLKNMKHIRTTNNMCSTEEGILSITINPSGIELKEKDLNIVKKIIYSLVLIPEWPRYKWYPHIHSCVEHLDDEQLIKLIWIADFLNIKIYLIQIEELLANNKILYRRISNALPPRIVNNIAIKIKAREEESLRQDRLKMYCLGSNPF